MGERLNGLSIPDCRLEDVEAVLELWRQAEATPGVTDTADDLRRAVTASAASVLVAEVEAGHRFDHRHVRRLAGQPLPAGGPP